MKKIVLLAFLLRILFSLTAYHGDLNNNLSWGKAASAGLAGFYEADNWPYSPPNQPPLSIILFSAVFWLWKIVAHILWWFNTTFPIFYSPLIWFWEAKGLVFLIKLPSILADLGIGVLIYLWVARKKRNLATKAAAVWLFNPISWYISSIWGQTDSIVNFLGIAALFSLIIRHYAVFSVLFVLSLLFKVSLIIFLPVILVFLLLQKPKSATWFKMIVAGALTVVLVSVWFHPAFDLYIWLPRLYLERILPGEIGFLTANAFNFWWLVNPDRVSDSVNYFGIPARAWGFVFWGLLLLYIIKILVRYRSEKTFLYCLALSALAGFLFLTRMHERYMYPFFPLSTILLVLTPVGFGFSYAILSLTYLLNLYHLFWAPSWIDLKEIYSVDWFILVISFFNIVVFIWLLFLPKIYLQFLNKADN